MKAGRAATSPAALNAAGGELKILERLRVWARVLKREVLCVHLAARHPDTPWAARALALFVAGYALSPIDLIPDFIPVLGYLDDLLLVPLGVWLVLRMLPPHVLAECRARAEVLAEQPVSRVAAALIVLLWLCAAAAIVLWYLRMR